ncbi:MAG TPA: kelch repeat-containing protein [Terriglobia bacterium]|nr:kelch repeat-containing protein [Terriglobia bacterium]
MRRITTWVVRVVVSVSVLAGVLLVVRGLTSPTPATGSWLSIGNMSSARAGASTVLLQDGRLLIAGGDAGSGALNSAEILDSSGAFSLAPPMNFARSKHTATVLSDGRVLVAGGVDTSGNATATAELYDPTANTWTPTTGPLMTARSGHTASLLADGTVLVAGGDSSGTALSSLEVFNPTNGTFTATVGTLSSARESHAAAVLAKGQVLIVGGTDGKNALASSDIYDPSTGLISTGPVLSIARQGLSATTQLDGKVLVVGGNNGAQNGSQDLASAEVYDPSAGTFALTGSLAIAREAHLAFSLPHNNGILIVGGTSAGAALASSELYYPWTGSFNPTGPMASARTLATGSPLSQDGVLLVAGGNDTTGVAQSSAELYGFATVKTDKADYPPGTTVNITGSGWQAGETVTLTMVESPLIDTHGPYPVTADASGNISDSSFTTDSHDINVTFTLTAVGQSSQAQTIFTDKVTTNTTVTCNPSSVGVNQPTTCTATVSPKNTSANVHGTVQWTITTGAGAFSSDGYNFSAGPPPTCTLTSTGATPPALICSVIYTPSSLGAQTLTATYAPDDQGKETSTSFGSVQIQVTADLVLQPPSPSSVSQGSTGPVTLEANLSALGNPIVGATITFTVDGTSVGTAVTDSSGNATITTYNPSALTVGNHTVQASFAGGTFGGTNYTIATSNTETLTVIGQGHIKVTKTTNPTSDTTTNFPVTLSSSTGGTSVQAAAETLTGNGGNFTYDVTPGTYAIAETPPAGWDQTANTCTGLVITAGQTVNCGITNVQKGHIKVTKTTNPTSDTTTNFPVTLSSSTGGTSTQAAAETLIGNGGTFTYDVTPGTYSIAEGATTGWDSTANTCTSANLVVAAGQTVNCGITNVQKGHIKVTKTTNPTSDTTTNFPVTLSSSTGGTSTQAAAETLTGNGGNFTYDVTPGTYSIAEGATTGWDSTANTCTSANLVVAAGQTVTCGITNVKQGHITVTKTTNPTSDTTTNFPVTLSSSTGGTSTQAAAETLTGNGGTFTYDVTPGTYSIAETAVTGWDQTADTCTSANLVVAAGQTVTCGISNARRPTLMVTKYLLPTNDTGKFNLFVANLSNASSYALASAVGNGGTGTATLSPGNYKAAETASTGTLSNYFVLYGGDCGSDGTITLSYGDQKACTITNVLATVTVATTSTPTVANQPQYSDPVTFTATISANSYSPLANTAEFYVGTQGLGGATDMGSCTLVNDGSGNYTCTTVAKPLISSSAPSPDANFAPGVHTVYAVFSGFPTPNPAAAEAQPTTSLTINQEDARDTYTGPVYDTVTAGSTSAIIPLSATIWDISNSLFSPTGLNPDGAYDAYPGNISNATVTFTDLDTGEVLCTNVPVTLVSAADSTTGTVSCMSASIPLNNTGSQSFTLGIKVGNYYTRNTTEDNVVITIAPPGAGFVTGGGYLITTTSIGEVPGSPGLRTNFGFNVKYNKSLSNLQGQINIIIRSKTVAAGDTCPAGPDGVHVYQVKSNSMTSLAVQNAGKYPATAQVVSGASITDVTNSSKTCSISGNDSIQLNMTDNSPGGPTDTISIDVLDKSNNLWYASATALGKIVQQQMGSPSGGGQVTVH